MKIAIMSDTHDNIWKFDEALTRLADTEVLLHCGDLCAPFMMKRIGEGYANKPVHVVWGNNDGDTYLLTKFAMDYPNIHLHGALATLDLGELKIAVNHYPEIARGLAHSGLYDIVCYGHNHIAHEEEIGGCKLLNPGEVLGMKGRSSFVILDAPSKALEWQDL